MSVTSIFATQNVSDITICCPKCPRHQYLLPKMSATSIFAAQNVSDISVEHLIREQTASLSSQILAGCSTVLFCLPDFLSRHICIWIFVIFLKLYFGILCHPITFVLTLETFCNSPFRGTMISPQAVTATESLFEAGFSLANWLTKQNTHRR